MLKLFFYISFITVILINAAASEEVKKSHVEIKLHRQKTSPFEQFLNNAKSLKKIGVNVDWLYKKHHKHSAPRTNDSISLYRYLDNEFYGKIVVGHPGQTLNVAFDTDWTLSWILSSECPVYTNFGCLFHNKYNHIKSSEYQPDGRPVNITDGEDRFSGYFSRDNVSVAHSNVTNFTFVEVNRVPISFGFNKIDGIIGLGIKDSDEYDPFFYKLLKQGKILKPIFCIYLNRDKASNNGGNIIMGFLEMRHVHNVKDKNNVTIYDDILYMPVKPGVYWEFDLDKITVKPAKNKIDLTLCDNEKCTAITDTSSNNIMGPKADIDKIHNSIHAKPFYFGRYTVDCETINQLPQIIFTIGGKEFYLKSRDYTIKLSFMSMTFCVSAFTPHDSSNLWVLGGAFLSEYYTIYNIAEKTIGIVKSA